MTIGKQDSTIIPKILFGMIASIQFSPISAMENPEPNGVQSSRVRSPEDYMKYSIDMDYIEVYTNGCLGHDIHNIAIPGGLWKLRDTLDALLKEKDLPYYDIWALADPRYKLGIFKLPYDGFYEHFSLSKSQLDVLGPLIGGHENFIKLQVLFKQPIGGKRITETVHHIDTISYFTNLEELNVSNYMDGSGRSESIKSLPVGIKNLRKLKTLTLDESCLESLSSDLNELPCLESLFLTPYNLNLDPIWTLTNLKKLTLKGGIIARQSFEPEYSRTTDWYHLKELPAEIGNLVNLEVLNLEMNDLKDLPETLSSLTNLKVLDLGFNAFETLPPVIGTLISLEKLCLTRSLLTEFPDVLFKLINLTELSLNRNRITKIPSKIHKLGALNKLNLEAMTDGLYHMSLSWAFNWERVPEALTPDELEQLRSQGILLGLENLEEKIKEYVSQRDSAIVREYAYKPKLQFFFADQKFLYDISTKNTLVTLWFNEQGIPPELARLLHEYVTDVHVRETVEYKYLHPVHNVRYKQENEEEVETVVEQEVEVESVEEVGVEAL